jgi:hypothetical protein
MDFRDFDDSLLYADPDYGEELYATWGGHDLSDWDDLFVPMLEDDDEGAWTDDEGASYGGYTFLDSQHGVLSPAAYGSGVISGSGAASTPRPVVSGGGTPAVLALEDVPVARPSSIRRFEAAVAASRLHLQTSYCTVIHSE